MLEPPLALLAHLRWNLRTYRSLPDADLYYLHSYNQYAAVRARSRRSAYVYDAHDSYFEVYPDDADGYRARLTPRLFAAIERRCVRGAARFTTVSEGVADLLERRFGRRPAVIRNCPDLRLDRPAERDVRSVAGVPADAFLLVSVGNAKPGMTVEEGLRALALLPERVQIAFVGGGMEAFRPLLAELGVEGRAHLLDPVPPTEVASFIETADAAPILYYAITPNFMNALPNRFFHAVAAGLPVLYPPLAEISRARRALRARAADRPPRPRLDRRRRAAAERGRRARRGRCARACAAPARAQLGARGASARGPRPRRARGQGGGLRCAGWPGRYEVDGVDPAVLPDDGRLDRAPRARRPGLPAVAARRGAADAALARWCRSRRGHGRASPTTASRSSICARSTTSR